MPNTLFADILQQELDLRVKVTGRSMRPFINNGDLVTLRKVSPESLKCGDIIYYTTKNETPVLHRIISKTVLPGNIITFRTKGDALLQKDEPIGADKLLGKAFYVEKSLPMFGPFSLNLDSMLSSGLYKIYAILISLKCKTRNYLKLVLTFPANK
jgi:signal peptidase I